MFMYLVWATFSIGMVAGSYKEWLPTTNLGDPQNWLGGRLPCGSDSVYVDEGTSLVYLQTDLSVGQLVLPRNAEMLLAEGKAITFRDGKTQPDSTCSGPSSDVHFKPRGSRDWFDPSNWCRRQSITSHCVSDGVDSEQVPCTYDDVMFPTQNTYTIRLDSDVTVGRLNISNKMLQTDSFGVFLTTRSGQSMFTSKNGSPPRITVQSAGCSDPTGCVCGNDDSQTMAKICVLRGACDTNLPCGKTSILPKGQCCPVCGAVLKLTYMPKFNIQDTRKQIRNVIRSKYVTESEEPTFPSVTVSKQRDDTVQVAIIDRDGRALGRQIGQLVVSAINKDIEAGGYRYNVTRVEVEMSRASASAQTGSLSTGQITGLVVGLFVVVLIGLLVALVLLKRTGRLQNVRVPTVNIVLPNIREFNLRLPNLGVVDFFSRMRKPAPNIGASVSFADPDNLTANISGFDNPMFGAEREDYSARAARSALAYDQPASPTRGFQNPMFDDIPQEMARVEGDQTLHMNPLYGDEPEPVTEIKDRPIL